MVITAAPAALGALAVSQIVAAINDDPTTVDWTTVGGVIGGFLGTGGVVGFVATYGAGTVTGACLTNGLAWLGGGAIAAGGYGMLGGLAVAGGIALSGVVAVGGATYYFVNTHRQKEIALEFVQWMEKLGISDGIPPEIHAYLSKNYKMVITNNSIKYRSSL